jgi:acyl-CoA thioesterase-1
MMLGFLAASQAEPAVFRELAAGKSQTVIVYGTSLTHGGQWAVAMKGWFDKEYPGQVKFINSGGPGENSDWGLANLKSKVLDHKPNLVLIEFSYNDAHQKFKMPVERGEENLRKIVEAIRAQDPNTTIVLQTMNVGWDAPNGKGSFSIRLDLESYNENYRRLARELGLPLLDHYAAWKKLKDMDPETYQRYIPDGTHPEAEGSLSVTWPAVKAWLEAGKLP